MILPLANVSFGILAFLPQGWIFMILIILLEVVVVSKVIEKKWFDKKIGLYVSIANIASGTFGLILSLLLNGGWWLVVWMPLVSSNEVDFSKHLLSISIYWLVAFFLSVLIEMVVEFFFLLNQVKEKTIFKACILSNLASYGIGGAVMYSISFGIY